MKLSITSACTVIMIDTVANKKLRVFCCDGDELIIDDKLAISIFPMDCPHIKCSKSHKK